ncbi:hypothetical protein SAMN05444410_102241 [Hydrobacter penzbergensis]|uniref:Uncharacterized protein n=1 Tax=Hydrobacter penzbergensis TaxID=1235997 RepID=A0A8X8IA74_9BACT|nr:hypothetical protein [Hydrobacter penzbergensis]SDW41290.1 hypothetical protein SAMN05444410_102241 [Hydrobacter penzbergensis]
MENIKKNIREGEPHLELLEMIIPLLIGKNSNGEDKYIDLAAISLLMVSYSRDNQLTEVISRLLQLNSYYKEKNYIIATSKIIQQNQHINNDVVFLKDDPGKSTVKSRLHLLKRVQREIKKREKVADKQELPHQFLIIDDVWDLVTAKPQSVGLSLMSILLDGVTVKVHTILASGLSYRNLLQQLIQINPSLNIELERRFGKPIPKQMNVLGTELIFSPDDLIFLKEVGDMEMKRFFR